MQITARNASQAARRGAIPGDSAQPLNSAVLAEDFSYAAIAERYSDTKLDAKVVRESQMQGECLVGLKELNFRKRDDFDPVAEWTNYRALTGVCAAPATG
jgi:hypothetical protein